MTLRTLESDRGGPPRDLVDCPECSTFLITLTGRIELKNRPTARTVLSARTRDHYRSTGAPLVIDHRHVGSAEAEALLLFGVLKR